jgi:hypothetical protein
MGKADAHRLGGLRPSPGPSGYTISLARSCCHPAAGFPLWQTCDQEVRVRDRCRWRHGQDALTNIEYEIEPAGQTVASIRDPHEQFALE